MNQAQRNFLIKKIEDQVKITCDALKEEKPEAPNLNNWLLHAVLSDNFELQPLESIREALRQKALNATKDLNWLTGQRDNWSSNSIGVAFKVSDIFILSDDYKQRRDNYISASAQIDEKIRTIKMQADTLITRIQLASDKTLDKMINEVDDMGDISLMDTKIRFLNS